MPTIFKDYESKQKKAIEEAEEGKAPAPAPAPAGGPRFEKSFTPEERKKQQAKLAELLRKRGD